MARPTPLGPNARGYIAGLLDLKGNAYYSNKTGLTLYISGVKSEAMQEDLKRWIGGGSISVSKSEGDRRGCTIHCKQPHFHYTRTSVKYKVTGLRAFVVLHTLEPSLFGWQERFAVPYGEAANRIDELSSTKDGEKILRDMVRRGWAIP